MSVTTQTKLASLYETDYQLWVSQTIAQLQTDDFDNLDRDHLIEEIASLGKSDKRAISSYLMRLCEHLLKLTYWESERSRCFRGWVLEINHFRAEIAWILQDSPSLTSFLQENFSSAYQKASKNLMKVLRFPSDFHPAAPTFTLEHALDEDWFPWQPSSILDDLSDAIPE